MNRFAFDRLLDATIKASHLAEEVEGLPFAVISPETAGVMAHMINKNVSLFIVIEELEKDARVHDRADNTTKAQIIRDFVARLKEVSHVLDPA